MPFRQRVELWETGVLYGKWEWELLGKKRGRIWGEFIGDNRKLRKSGKNPNYKPKLLALYKKNNPKHIKLVNLFAEIPQWCN